MSRPNPFVIIRNTILSLLGLRWRERVQNAIPDDEDTGAITLTTFESRPWWDYDRIVDEKIIDWRQDDE